jgi:glycosyltransferase involved in cell wall biosynthesis
MIIGIDANEANVEKRVGIGRYAYELLSRFASLKPRGIKFQIYLKSKPLPDMPKESNSWQYMVLRPGKLWTQWRLPLELFITADKPDVFFSPSHYAPRFSIIPTVISVMDLSYKYFPELFEKNDLYQLQSWTSYSVRRAKKVLTISNASKNDIIDEYKVKPDKVKVTYLAPYASKALSMDKVMKKYKIGKNFILFVGTLQPRKNITRLIEAFSLVVLKDSQKDLNFVNDLKLVVIGKKGWLYDEILNAPKDFGVEDRVIFLEEVKDEELPVFYKNAKCFVLPSLYEGFGLPVLEAMQWDCPVIASNVSSLPEVGGSACLYIDPENSDDIAEKIWKLVSNEKLRSELISKGKKQVKKFSWDRTARETLKVLKEVAES